MQDSAITSVSEITPGPSSSFKRTQNIGDHSSQGKELSLMLKEVNERAEELESLGKQYAALNNSRKSKSRSISNTEDYKDIVFNKGIFLDNLTQAVDDVVHNSLHDSNYTMHCYNQFSSLLETRCNESKQEIQQKTELLKEQKSETARLISQGNIFANLDDDEENEDWGNREHRQASIQFNEAKADLAKVINLAYPNEEDKKPFLLVMALLVEAYINNLDSLEDQYVEVLPTLRHNPGLRCLMDGCVVVEHPHDPSKLRLSIED